MSDAIDDKEIVIEFIRASGPGGQHRNVTETGVRIRHIPSGIVVQATESRSQARNRQVALERLQAALERRARVPKKRQRTNVPKAERERRLTDKRRDALRRKQRRTVED